MTSRAALISAAWILTLAGCGKAISPGDPTLPPSCLPACPGTRSYDAIGYALSGQFDWSAQRLVATEEITLALAPGSGPVVELDSAVAVTAVHVGTQKLAYTPSPASGTLRVDLTPLSPGVSPVTFTVEYLAYPSSALIATSSTAADPVRTRVVYTDSEPRGGHQWLVQKDDPSDRALFSVALTVAADEDVIANGQRMIAATVPGGRRVIYALDVPIPTYLMAFAAGQLTHTDRTSASGVPLSLWYRRGLALDPADALDALADAMSSYEALLGPYPFASYGLVLLPGYGGGMENATITFEGEKFSQGPYYAWLHTHELAHHWFGDQVTMHGYDDVWVKEGMATLLAAEASRSRIDLQGRGRLMGSNFSFNPADKIVDPTLTGLAKYTSGPYERSAALITQLRALVGETVFWSKLRGFLADYSMGSATGEQFVRAFAPDLSELEILQVLAILPQSALPAFTAELLPAATPTQVRLTLSDPTNLMLVPYRLTSVDAAGTVTTCALTAGAPIVLDLPAGGYLAPDEDEAFPDFPVANTVFDTLAPYLEPSVGTAPGDQFASRSASHQERALLWAGLPALTPGQFQAFYDSLDSDWGTIYALQAACSLVKALPGADQPAWISVLAPVFQAPRAAWPSIAYAACGPALGATFLAEFQTLASNTPAAQVGRLEYLLSFDYAAAGAAAMAQVASSAPSLKLRQKAQTRINCPTCAFSMAPLDTAPVPASSPFAGGAAALEGKATRSGAQP